MKPFGARFDKVEHLRYFSLLLSVSTIVASCSIYRDDLLTNGGGTSSTGSGGTTIDGASGGNGGEAPDASTGSGGTGASTGGSGGGTGGGGGSSTGGSAGGAGGDAGGTDMGGTAGTNATGGVAGTAGTTGAGGSITAGAAGTGATAGSAGTGGAAGNAGAGGATGTAGTGGSTGGAGSGGAMDAGPEAPALVGAVFAVGSFTKGTATGSQTVPHTLGQRPKALILWTAGKTNETLSSGFYYGIGISDPTISVALAMSTRDAVATSSSSRRIASKAITLVQGGETIIAEANLPSWGSASFTLNWTTNDGQPYIIHYLVIGGPQVAAKIVNWQAPTGPGSKTVAGVGFQPEAVLHFHAGGAFVNAPPFNQEHAVLGMGAMDKTGAQWASQASDGSGKNPTVSSRGQRNDAAIYTYTDTGTASVTKVATFVSMDSDGFTLNFTTASTNASQMYSLALGGLKAGVGTFDKTTAGAPASQSVSTGFAPGAVFMTSYQMAAQTAPLSEPTCSFGVGAGDGTTEASSAIVSRTGTSPTSVDGQDKTSKVFIKMNNPPLDAEADMASFGPTGFTLNFTTNDAVASQICFLALGAP